MRRATWQNRARIRNQSITHAELYRYSNRTPAPDVGPALVPVNNPARNLRFHSPFASLRDDPAIKAARREQIRAALRKHGFPVE